VLALYQGFPPGANAECTESTSPMARLDEPQAFAAVGRAFASARPYLVVGSDRLRGQDSTGIGLSPITGQIHE